MKKFLLISGICVLIVMTSLQFIRPKISHPPVTQDFQAPTAVKAILVRACYDCHSNDTHLRWYDQIQPVYWQVAQHIKDGRKGLNFSEWDKLAPPERKAKLWEAVNQMDQGAMPLKSYAFIHGVARVSSSDLGILRNYLQGMLKSMPDDTTKIHARDEQARAVKTAENKGTKTLNGITYMPDYGNWQMISISDRFDNGTMRVIYGNAIAMKAVKEHRINPWPNGTVFAKAAWDQLEDSSGHVTTGAFKQVEFMIKDAEKYKSTQGWGFARFKTAQLVPYGKTAMFTNECISCHAPMKDNDLVFTFPIKN